MYLIACHYVDEKHRPPKVYQEAFCYRASKYQEDLLAYADRLTEYLVAGALLARYHITIGIVEKGLFLATSQ